MLSSPEPAVLSRFFSPSVIRDFAAKSKSSLYARLLRQAGFSGDSFLKGAVGDSFDQAFRLIMRPGLRDEYVYRSALANKILLGRHSLNTATMLNELRVGYCKADVVILNGTSTVYEIKSERDSLARLERQLLAYRQVFANLYVVVGERHFQEVLREAPPEVGVLQLTNRQTLSVVRKATESLEYFDSLKVLDVLRSGEAVAILRRLGVDVPKVSNMRRHAMLESYFVDLDPHVLHREMVVVLKETRSQAVLSGFLDKLPVSLRALGLAIKPNVREQERILTAIQTPIDEALAWN